MDVQAKINCSLDDLIKFQRKAARGPAVNGTAATPPKKAAPQRVNNKIGINKKAQNTGRQRPYTQRPQQQHQESFSGKQQQRQLPKQQQQQNRTPTVVDKINLPLDAVIAKQHQQQRRQLQQQTKPQQQQQQLRQKGRFAVGKKQQGFIRRRGGFVATRDDQRRGRADAATAAALAIRSAVGRSAAAKSISATRPRGGRQRTARQQVVETLKSAAAFKPSAGARLKRRSGPFISDRAKASLAAPGGRRLGNGRLALRRQPLAGAALAGTSRTNTSLARRRPLGPAAARHNTNPVQAARSSSSYPSRTGYTTSPPVATRPMPIDRRRPPSPTSTTAPSFAADPEMLANIKIMATLDTVPPPLPQQRGAHVAVPAAMQQQQQQEQQPPRAGAVLTADSETLSSRFGY